MSFCFHIAKKKSASLRSSIWQFENLTDAILCSITEQCMFKLFNKNHDNQIIGSGVIASQTF